MTQILQKENLPKGWVETDLDCISQIKAGHSPPQDRKFFKNGMYNFVMVRDMGQLNDDVYLTQTDDKINELGIKKLTLFPKGSVLFTKSGASLLLNQRAILKQNSYVNSPIGISIPFGKIPSEFIYYFLKIVDFAIYSEGTIVPSVGLSKIEKFKIPLPPLNEQKRIILKIEELFSNANSTKKSLEQTKLQLRQYEHSFLKSAFEGRLTKSTEPSETVESLKEQFAMKHKKKNSKPEDFFKFQTELPELPKNWTYASLDFIANDIISGGTPLKSDPNNFDKNGIPLLKVENIRRDGNIVIEKEQLRLSETAHKKQFRSIIKENDVLFNIVGPPLDVIGFVTKEYANMNINQALVLVRTIQFYNPRLLFYCLRSPFYYNLMYNMGRGNRQDNIKTSDAKLIPIPLIPTNHQKIILEKIDALDEQRKTIFKNIEHSLNHMKELRLSILKQAFEGKLVPQDPNDEPASVLLERIQKEKIKT